MSNHPLSNAKLTEIYKQANGQAEGKSHPVFTENVFKAMRAVFDRYHEFIAPTPKAIDELLVERDPEEFMVYRDKILLAMQTTPLEYKSDIVDQLAWRDQQIDKLEQALKQAVALLGEVKR